MGAKKAQKSVNLVIEWPQRETEQVGRFISYRTATKIFLHSNENGNVQVFCTTVDSLMEGCWIFSKMSINTLEQKRCTKK